jgi:hypothetical protein
VALDGSGTEQDPWLIKSLEDFNDFAADANYWAGFTRLETDVNLAGITYTTAVIAPDVNSFDMRFQGTAFTGVFDGNDHKVLNLTINGGVNDYLGLFGYIYEGQVSNLGLESGSVSGDYVVGGQVGVNRGSVSNSYSTVDVNGVSFVGGLVGQNEYGNISNCYSTGFVSGPDVLDATYGDTGGLVGGNFCGSISNCCSTGSVSGDKQVGGLVGGNDGVPFNSSISNSYSTGNVSGRLYIGGLVGFNQGAYSVSNCYSTGDVYGVDKVGGLVGQNSPFGNISHCYSTGDVNGVDSIGGLVGVHFSSISYCYWDIETQTHGVTESTGHYTAGTVTNVSGLLTTRMQTRSTFTDADWDFINVWNIGENQTYPYLRTYLPSDINKDGIVNFLDLSITANQWMEGDTTDE